MPQLTPSTVSILPSQQTSGGSLKEKANAFRYNAQKSPDANLWSTVGDAFSNAQSQIDNITAALRLPLPQPQVIQITNPQGVLIAQIGNMTGANNVAYPGIWATDLYIGGTGPDTAVIVADSSGVTITGADIVLNGNGITTIINNATNPWSGQGASLVSTDNMTGFYSAVDPFDFVLLDSANNPIAALVNSPSGGNGFGELFIANTQAGNNHQITADGGNGLIQTTDGTSTTSITPTNVDSKGFSANGTPGINKTIVIGSALVNTTGSFGVSLSVATSATAVFGTPGVGQSNGSVVTGVTLSVSGALTSSTLTTNSDIWKEGLLTT